MIESYCLEIVLLNYEIAILRLRSAQAVLRPRNDITRLDS